MHGTLFKLVLIQLEVISDYKDGSNFVKNEYLTLSYTLSISSAPYYRQNVTVEGEFLHPVYPL